VSELAEDADTRVNTARAKTQAAVTAMEDARRTLGEIIDEGAPTSVRDLITFASVDLGHSIREAGKAVREMTQAIGDEQ